MIKVRFKFTPTGAYQIRSAPGVVAFLEGHGERVLSEANKALPTGSGYKMSSKQGKRRPHGRWAVRVYTATNEAKRDSAANNTLFRILGSSGG